MSSIARAGLSGALRDFAASAERVARPPSAAAPSAAVPHTSDGDALTTVAGADRASEIVAQISAQRAFSANLAVLRADREIQAELVKVAR